MPALQQHRDCTAVPVVFREDFQKELTGRAGLYNGAPSGELNSSKTAANAANQPGRTAGLSAAGGLGQMRMNAKKKEKTRRETTAIKVWVTPAEKAAITVKADAYSLSASTYLRELALRSTRPPTRPSEKINHRGKRTDLQRVRTVR